MFFQGILSLVLLIIAILFLRWLWHRWFSKTERDEPDELVSKKVELRDLRRRKEDLEEEVGVTEEVLDLRKQIEQEEQALKELEKD